MKIGKKMASLEKKVEFFKDPFNRSMLQEILMKINEMVYEDEGQHIWNKESYNPFINNLRDGYAEELQKVREQYSGGIKQQNLFQ